MFLSCEICGEDIFVDHFEFHMSEHIGMGTALQLFRHNQEEREKKEDGTFSVVSGLELLVHRIGFRRRLL